MSDTQGIVSTQDLQPWLKEKYAKWWSMVKLGYDATMLQRMQRQFKASEIIADISMKGTTDGVTSLYPDNVGEDMAVNIGNEYHYHGVTPPATTAPITSDPSLPALSPDPIVNTTNTTSTTNTEKVVQIPAPQVIQVPVQQPVKSSLPAYILGGAALLSSLGGWGLAWYNSHKPPYATVPTVDTDTDHETDVIFPQ